MLRIKFERIVQPKTMMSPVQEIEKRAVRRLVLATAIIILALAGHVGFDILGQQHLEYQMAVCEFDAKNTKSSYEFALGDKQNELEECEIRGSAMERYITESCK